MNRKKLITLTLEGPTWENLVVGPLAVQQIDNQLSLFCSLHTFNYFIFSYLLHFSVCLLVQKLLGTLFLLFLFSFVILCSADYFCWSNCSKICKGFFSSSLQRERVGDGAVLVDPEIAILQPTYFTVPIK